MKVSGDGLKISGIYDRRKQVDKTDKIDKSNKAGFLLDSVSISKESSIIAKDYKTVMDSIKKLPDIREDKVKELKETIENKKYTVDANEIVNRLLNSLKDKRI